VTVTFVTDQTFVAAMRLLSQVPDDRIPIVSIFASLFFVETDDIPTVLYPDFLDFERYRILGFAALRNALERRLSAAKHG
jgi:hypothetical protein